MNEQSPVPEKNVENKAVLTMPVAIVIAGFLIAGAIMFTHTPINANGGTAKTSDSLGNPNSKAALALTTCMASGKYAPLIESQQADGLKIGITGTPTSILKSKDGKMIRLVGAQKKDAFLKNIDGLISGNTDGLEVENIDMAPITPSDHSIGSLDADVVIVEYSDTECPFCKTIHPVLHEIVKQYGGKVAWVYRHFPLDSIHPKTRKEAEATECAAELGGNEVFWAYLDKIFENTPANNGLDPRLLAIYFDELKVPIK